MRTKDFDTALQLFRDKFYELHPRDTLPTWFRNCVTFGAIKEGDKSWRIEYTALPKGQLDENEFWETRPNGGMALVSVDPETGEKSYIISNTTENVLTIFEAIVDLNTSEVLVTVNKDLREINGEDLEPYQL